MREVPMTKPKVYFTTMRTKLGEGLPSKLQRLIKAAGIEKINFKDKFVAIKIHFGEPGNLAFLRPNYATARWRTWSNSWAASRF